MSWSILDVPTFRGPCNPLHQGEEQPDTMSIRLLLALMKWTARPTKPSLKGKTVWITGASTGIGEHLAYVLAKAGCKLILSARRVAELERVKKTCLEENRNLTDNDVEIYPMDVLDLDLHEKAFEHVINKFGKLDILVNNAGRSQRAKWENIEIAVDKEMFNLNVFSILSLSRIVVKHFLKIGKGQIVNTSSLAGIVPVPMSATYCGTKHALHGYFKPFFLEYPDNNISMTMVCPGPVQTEFLAKSFTEKSGENYGVTTDISKNKISVERCAILMGVAIANELDEVWISTASSLRLVYMTYCFPNFAKWYVST
ncbi:Dehydrogenase/reductase SDR family member 7 [Acromyrmex echinatior]|uniref:Dehydrogenase/reductase SDR family member 7 n=1 Tax=Acromyrmex echinatior TaxID=103372 RepID=F4WVM8_ACREC|nr:Dehydrogenase/reductase SDR family member 7 [Acromyrmex echinatior]